jgi:hypothetical protein
MDGSYRCRHFQGGRETLMYLTEKEARDKWCHQAMTPQALKRQDDLFAPAICSASECMAWRWGATDGWCLKCGGLHPSVNKDGKCKCTDKPTRQGYCGLAGNPEVV